MVYKSLLTLQNEIAELELLLAAKKQLLEEVKISLAKETVQPTITQNPSNYPPPGHSAEALGRSTLRQLKSLCSDPCSRGGKMFMQSVLKARKQENPVISHLA